MQISWLCNQRLKVCSHVIALVQFGEGLLRPRLSPHSLLCGKRCRVSSIARRKDGQSSIRVPKGPIFCHDGRRRRWRELSRFIMRHSWYRIRQEGVWNGILAPSEQRCLRLRLFGGWVRREWFCMIVDRIQHQHEMCHVLLCMGH